MTIHTHTAPSLAAVAYLLLSSTNLTQNTFELTIPVPGLTNVADGHQTSDGGFVRGGGLSAGLVVVRTDCSGQVL